MRKGSRVTDNVERESRVIKWSEKREDKVKIEVGVGHGETKWVRNRERVD